MIDKEKLKKQAAEFFDDYSEFEPLDIKSFNSSRTLVIVVDMIKGFCVSGALSSQNCNSIAPDVAKFLSQVPRAEKAFVRDSHADSSIEFSSFPPHCIAESLESCLVDELKGFTGHDIAKNSTNAFFALQKAMFDFAKRFDKFVLIGVCTDICVMQLALTLRTYFNENDTKGKEVAVIAPLTQTFDLGKGHPSDFMNAVTLKLMQASGVKIYN